MAVYIKKKVITVDVGWDTGIAIWSDKDKKSLPEVLALSLPSILKSESIPIKIQYLGEKFSEIVYNHLPAIVILEGIAVWGSSATSQASATGGDSIKTAYLCGAFALVASEICDDVRIVHVNEWKGQLTKGATKIRVKRSLGVDYSSTHKNDAVGIGLSLIYNDL